MKPIYKFAAKKLQRDNDGFNWPIDSGDDNREWYFDAMQRQKKAVKKKKRKKRYSEIDIINEDDGTIVVMVETMKAATKFKNGFPSVGVCDSLKDACPRCNATDETATTSMKGTYAQHVSPNSGMQSRKRKPANRSISPPRLKIAAQTRSSTRLNVSGASNGLTDVKNDKNNHIVTVERVVDDDDEELVEDVPHTSADYNSSVFDEDETQDFEEDHELDVKPDPAKMIWKDSQNRDTLQCQICARRVLRNEHTGNVNHLSRHSRTHASTKQFSCSICGSTTTRRYMAINHVKVLHPSVESPHTHIVDHGKELRTEYIGLLDKCFPGIRGHRTGIRMYRDDSNEPSEHGDDVEEVPNSES